MENSVTPRLIETRVAACGCDEEVWRRGADTMTIEFERINGQEVGCLRAPKGRMAARAPTRDEVRGHLFEWAA